MTAALTAALLAAMLASAAALELARLPPAPRRLRPVVRRWSAAREADESVERLLDAAGRREVPDAAALRRRSRGAAVLGSAWCAALALPIAGPVPALGAAAVGWAAALRLPRLLLATAGRRRCGRLRDECPEVLELVAVAAACGLPVAAICARVPGWVDGELAAGLERCAGELAAGAGVEEALQRFAAEHPVPEIEAAVAILLRSRRHGTPAAPALRALAHGARDARVRRAMDHAAKAAPRVQLVAALLLVPAALLVLAAAIVARAA